MARASADARGNSRILEDVRACLESQENAMVAAAMYPHVQTQVRMPFSSFYCPAVLHNWTSGFV
jgi:hypothetical protein